ncbi:MAG TPA: hypothetical protein VG935_03455 [Patescibacteria group bacterium]|nr:hypothetical protein [Patescibacteria group bacterium]
MITIVHGSDIAASRNYLGSLRLSTPEAVLIDGATISITDFQQALDSGGFFNDGKTIIVEHLYNRKKAKKEFDALIAIIQGKTLENEIILWEDKELDKRSLAIFPHATIKNYKLPQTLFLFLDSLQPSKGRQLVQLFHQALSGADEEMIFFMLIRQVRLLLALHDKTNETIDEAKRLAPWQLNKLQRQAKQFSIEQLIVVHTRFFELDKAMKTGELTSSLSTAIDILLLDI